MLFRFDDMCKNTDMRKATYMAEYLKNRFSGCEILFCISPIGNNVDKKENVFPLEYMPYSDPCIFYDVDYCYVPEFPKFISIANHGLIHVDHRLLSYGAQEMSILVAASLTKSNIFVPPFHHWNKDTEDICRKHGIDLIKYEDGWYNLKYSKFDSSLNNWYLHSYEFTIDSFLYVMGN
jgi:hypothetical protein